MATEMAPPTNGLYGNQYGQPAELAASTPSAPAHASSVSQSSTAASNTANTKADPQEIGWYFVEQYYTNLSKSPERIHLFYNKKSQLVTGVEAEKVVPAVGIKVRQVKQRRKYALTPSRLLARKSKQWKFKTVKFAC